MIRWNPRQWGKVPLQLLEDEHIELIHLKIYVVMSGKVKYGTNICDLGQRQIANVLRISQMTVNRRQDELAGWGHIKQVPQANGKRGLFAMLSPVFDVAPRGARTAKKMRTNSVRTQAAAWAKIRDERERQAG